MTPKHAAKFDRIKAQTEEKYIKPKHEPIINNPKGYNMYNKNPNPPVKREYTEEERKQYGMALYQAALKFRRLANSALARSRFMLEPKDDETDKLSDLQLIEMARRLE